MKFLAQATKLQKLAFLFFLFLLGCLATYLLKPSYLVNIILVYTVPTLVTVSQIGTNARKKVLLFSTATTLFVAIPVEIGSRLADAWDVASIFPRIFGIAPLENVLYALINFLWPLAIYEWLFKNDAKSIISSRFKILIALEVLVTLLFYPIYFIDKEMVTVGYWKTGVLAVFIPLLYFLWKKVISLENIFLISIFFAMVFFIHEVLSMELGHWWWPGEYLVTTELFGHRFPLDDLVIWYGLMTPSLLLAYEYFIYGGKGKDV